MVLYHKLLRDGVTVFDSISVTFTPETTCVYCKRSIREIPIRAQINSEKEIRFICNECLARQSQETVQD